MNISELKTAGKLITGLGAVKTLPSEMSRLCIHAFAIVTDKGVSSSGLLEHIKQILPNNAAIVIDDIPPEPEITVIEEKLQLLRQKKVDGVIALGGGSAIDSAKILAATYDYPVNLSSLFGENTLEKRTLPLIAIPTTAGTGSEVTNIAILCDPETQMKKGIVSHCLLPDVAIVAPEMTKTCPKTITAASGIDAFVHALEAYVSVNATPITDALAERALTLIFKALPHAYNNGENLSAREDMATGSLMAGLAFGNAGVGAVHALAYPLGGRFHLSHGMSNAVMLPHVMKVNAPFCSEKLYCVAKLLNVCESHHSKDEAVQLLLTAIERLCRNVNIPQSLKHFDIPEDCLNELAIEASKVTRLLRNNPKQLSVEEIENIYRHAF